MTLWKAMLYKLTDLEMPYKVSEEQQVGTRNIHLSLTWFIFTQEDTESVL